MKIIAIGGEPATGKTYLIKTLRKNESKPKIKSFKLLKYEKVIESKIIYLGKYEGNKFDGTDRLSMGVQPDAVKFFKFAKERYNEYTIIFEGDRLFNQTFLKELSSYQLATIIITAEEKTIQKRHGDREDTQKQTFLKGRKTKLQNISKIIPYIKLTNNTKEDMNNNLKILKKLIKLNGENFDKFVKERSTISIIRQSSGGIRKFF